MIYVKKNPKHSCMYKFDPPPPGMGGGGGRTQPTPEDHDFNKL